MYTSSDLPWMRIHEFLLEVGNVRDPKELCVQAIKKIQSLIPYEQARVYFVNDLGKVYDQVLIEVDPFWSELYLEYYSKIEDGRYGISLRAGHYPIPRFKGGVYDWTDYRRDQFVREYIMPQGLKYSAGFALHDPNGCIKSVFCIDRIGLWEYTQKEIDIMSVIQPHLDNLHKNLFVLVSRSMPAPNADIQAVLTKREFQIARMLCQGMTPVKISRTLYLSLATVYKHIANIHAKLGVSNRQELLLLLMNSGESKLGVEHSEPLDNLQEASCSACSVGERW